MSKAFTLKEGIFKDIPSNVYHTIPGTFSSSQLKDGYNDIFLFHKKYITKEIERETIEAFDIGTYFHTAILEPEKVKMECAVFKGVRRGKEWEKFQAENKDKAIVTESGLTQAETLIQAVRNSRIAMTRIARGEPELSGFVLIRVVGIDIFAVNHKKKLAKFGWVDAQVPKNGVDIWLKVRADLLADTFILDLKSMSGNVRDRHAIQTKISGYGYDLSAALYLDLFSLLKGRTLTDFIWTFASKDMGLCQNYMASAKNIRVGRAKWRQAILNIAEGMELDWDLPDTMIELDPAFYENDILKEDGADLL